MRNLSSHTVLVGGFGRSFTCAQAMRTAFFTAWVDGRVAVSGVPQQDVFADRVADIVLASQLQPKADIAAPDSRPAVSVPAGRVEEYAVDLRQHDHRFLKGHRIMIQVQSSWFPVYDRNPQTYVPNIFDAPASAYRAPSTGRPL